MFNQQLQLKSVMNNVVPHDIVIKHPSIVKVRHNTESKCNKVLFLWLHLNNDIRNNV